MTSKKQPQDLIRAKGLLVAGSELLLTLLLLLLLLAIPSRAQTFTVLHQFNGGKDGANPAASLFLDSSGNLYGTTFAGGSFDYGMVFEIDTSGKETVLHGFWSGDGGRPQGGLIRDTAGNLIGSTSDGGTPKGGECSHGCGTIFRVDPAGKFTEAYAFSTSTDGGGPTGSLVADQEGNLYGTTTVGGSPRVCGVVFKLDPDGKESELYAFKDFPDGCQPVGGLVQDKAGNFYGVTYAGGVYTYGSVFKVDRTGKEKVLYSFKQKGDGEYPEGPVALDTTGNLYGGAGEVIFKLDKAGHETVLHSFTGPPDGSGSVGGVILDSIGNVYGVTVQGGSGSLCSTYGCGTVYKVDTNGKETVLYSFTGKSDGLFPRAGLVMDGLGNLYGTTYNGGNSSSCGVVFKLTP
jgi:uncharacterized repeat protein (TIGR03803 family)